MPDIETVIRGLESFISDFKPFVGNKADWQKVFDALELLKQIQKTGENGHDRL